MESNKLNEKLNFLVCVFYYTTILLISFLILKFIILEFLTPFLVGFLIAFILKPISNKISSKTKINNKFCRIVLVVLTFGLIIFLIWQIGIKIVAELKTIANSSQEIYENYLIPIKDFFDEKIKNFLNSFFPNLNGQTTEILESITWYINDFITYNSKYILTLIARLGKSIPQFIIETLFAVMSSIYFIYDYEKITSFIINMFPKKAQHYLHKTKSFTINTIVKYVKSYSYLTFICFLLLSIGFLIIKIKNPIGTAAIVSCFDAIPFVGSGIVIIPWALILLISNNLNLAISLLVTFAIINLIRSFLEPKILGAGIGMHPIATLITIYLGAKIIGFLGIILAPILTQIAFSLYKYKKDSEDS